MFGLAVYSVHIRGEKNIFSALKGDGNPNDKYVLSEKAL